MRRQGLVGGDNRSVWSFQISGYIVTLALNALQDAQL